MSEIVDHQRYGSAVTKKNGFTGKHSNIPKKTPRGWGVLIKWRDETTTWLDIKYVKESSLIDLTEYAVANQIAYDTAFSWWLPYTPKKRNTIISKVKTNYWRTPNKYGVRIPNNVTEEMQIDNEDVNTYWKDVIEKDMKKDNISYEPM